jgi:hypothetical protein
VIEPRTAREFLATDAMQLAIDDGGSGPSEESRDSPAVRGAGRVERLDRSVITSARSRLLVACPDSSASEAPTSRMRAMFSATLEVARTRSKVRGDADSIDVPVSPGSWVWVCDCGARARRVVVDHQVSLVPRPATSSPPASPAAARPA